MTHVIVPIELSRLNEGAIMGGKYFMTSVLNVCDIDSRFRSGLIFSIYEGLLQGGSLQVIVGENAEHLEAEFRAAALPNMKWVTQRLDNGTWEITITKRNSKEEGCCGLCKGERNAI